MPQFTVDTLVDIGFVDVGCWSARDTGKLDYRLDRPTEHTDKLLLEETNSLYAFIHGGEVKYVGKTARTLRERFAGYRNPQPSQSMNVRCNAKILQALEKGQIVRIFVFNPISHLRYGEFEVNLAAGLEDSLIAAFSPPWNGRERNQSISEEAERESKDVGEQENTIQNLADSAPASSLSLGSLASFEIKLGEAYFNQGIINPGKDASLHLGNDHEPIVVNFDDGTASVVSRINRTANGASGQLVRITDRNRRVGNWFREHFRQGDILQARVQDRNKILLLRKP